MTTGPEYYAAAQAALAKAARSAEAGYTAKADQELRFAEANMAMARLSLDAAKAVAGGHLIEGFDTVSDGENADPLTRNVNAWAAAVIEGGA